MKSLIYALTIAGASLALISSGVAQGPGGPPGGMRGGPGGGGDMRAMMKKREDAMYAQLHLTPEQKHKIEVFRKERDAKMAKMMATMPKGGGRGAFQALRPVMKDYRDKVTGILKPDQAAKLDALRKAARARGGGRGGPGGPGGPPPGGPGGRPPGG